MKGKQVGNYNFKIILQNQIEISLFCQIQEVVTLYSQGDTNPQKM